ncbi:hypothetical protein PR048_028395 [Dryococelus australis]|uniref:Uncharacterized protein n=1 Tax=Dryococelus australis TaxID=614101 RepID=A0ABQ9GAF5_9NEOP|nr:hypothetical protein PR048_028395 [Dryococelus australis]
MTRRRPSEQPFKITVTLTRAGEWGEKCIQNCFQKNIWIVHLETLVPPVWLYRSEEGGRVEGGGGHKVINYRRHRCVKGKMQWGLEDVEDGVYKKNSGNCLGRRSGGETGDPRENPPIKGIVQQDSHMRKSRVNLIALVGGERANRSATMAPGWGWGGWSEPLRQVPGVPPQGLLKEGEAKLYLTWLYVASGARSRSKGAIRATVTSTPSTSSLLREGIKCFRHNDVLYKLEMLVTAHRSGSVLELPIRYDYNTFLFPACTRMSGSWTDPEKNKGGVGSVQVTPHQIRASDPPPDPCKLPPNRSVQVIPLSDPCSHAPEQRVRERDAQPHTMSRVRGENSYERNSNGYMRQGCHRDGGRQESRRVANCIIEAVHFYVTDFAAGNCQLTSDVGKKRAESTLLARKARISEAIRMVGHALHVPDHSVVCITRRLHCTCLIIVAHYKTTAVHVPDHSVVALQDDCTAVPDHSVVALQDDCTHVLIIVAHYKTMHTCADHSVVYLQDTALHVPDHSVVALQDDCTTCADHSVCALQDDCTAYDCMHVPDHSVVRITRRLHSHADHSVVALQDDCISADHSVVRITRRLHTCADHSVVRITRRLHACADHSVVRITGLQYMCLIIV